MPTSTGHKARAAPELQVEKRCPITLSKKAKFRAEGPAPPVSVPALGALPKQAGFVIGPLAVASACSPVAQW
jgi:hypothetical protein